ncbi:hypothetical protein [Coleofasciculus sp. LEGE 07092]|nr:hypothetical protein [Coleofasciculus sp. LEGE 07092]MBE9125156.1 hypothetical protein [Coleofasciculus sp. LEGE 07081]MBE9148373.1 hypothetical protein [Coleofasciculus sp. LEGE 07092]
MSTTITNLRQDTEGKGHGENIMQFPLFDGSELIDNSITYAIANFSVE